MSRFATDKEKPLLSYYQGKVLAPDVASVYPGLTEDTVPGLRLYGHRAEVIPVGPDGCMVLKKTSSRWDGYRTYLRSICQLGCDNVAYFGEDGDWRDCVEHDVTPVFFKQEPKDDVDPNDKIHFRSMLEETGLTSFSPMWSASLDNVTFEGPYIVKQPDSASGVGTDFCADLNDVTVTNPIRKVLVEQDIRPSMKFEGSVQLIVTSSGIYFLGTTLQLVNRTTHIGNVLRGEQLSKSELDAVYKIALWVLETGYEGYASIDYARMKDGSMIMFEVNARMGGVTHAWAVLEQLKGRDVYGEDSPYIISLTSVYPDTEWVDIRGWDELKHFHREVSEKNPHGGLFNASSGFGAIPVMPYVLPEKLGYLFIGRSEQNAKQIARAVLQGMGSSSADLFE